VQGFAPDEFIERGLHYNLFTKACETTATALSLLAEVRGVLDITNGLGPKPLWITEIGWKREWLDHWAAVHGTTADIIEAAYLARTYVPLLSEAGVEKVFWYTQTNLEDPVFNLGPGGQRALGNLSALLNNSQPLGQVQGQNDRGRPGDDDVYEYRFARHGKQIVVLWKARGGMAARDVLVSNVLSDTVRLYPIDALDVPPAGGSLLTANNDAVTVTLNEQPVLLVFTPRSSWDTFWRDLRTRIEDWWQNAQSNISDWWTEQQAKLARWWEEQRAILERQVAQWLDDLQRQLEDAVQKQIEEALNELCGAAFVLPGGLMIAAWWLRQRGRSG
jgi:gas vesicle protein